jgi:hypothetical protein
MVYDDDTGQPPFLPIPCDWRVLPAGVLPPPLDGGQITAVRRVAWANPRWGPQQVTAELRRAGRGVGLAAVRFVMRRLLAG